MSQLHLVKHSDIEFCAISGVLSLYLCFLDDVGKLSTPHEAVLWRDEKEAVSAVERAGRGLHQAHLHVSAPWRNVENLLKSLLFFCFIHFVSNTNNVPWMENTQSSLLCFLPVLPDIYLFNFILQVFNFTL